MNVLSRRIFVKAFLATAASSLPAYAAVDKAKGAVVLPSLESEETSAGTNIESGNQRIRISPVGTPFTYQNFVRVGKSDAWKPSTLAGVPVVTGASFPLLTSRVRQDRQRVRCEGQAEAVDINGKALKYDWEAEITASGRQPSRPVAPVSDDTSSPGAPEVAAQRVPRASNHHLAEFDLLLNGRPIGKLAARAAGPANAEFTRHVRQ